MYFNLFGGTHTFKWGYILINELGKYFGIKIEWGDTCSPFEFYCKIPFSKVTHPGNWFYILWLHDEPLHIGRIDARNNITKLYHDHYRRCARTPQWKEHTCSHCSQQT